MSLQWYWQVISVVMKCLMDAVMLHYQNSAQWTQWRLIRQYIFLNAILGNYWCCERHALKCHAICSIIIQVYLLPLLSNCFAQYYVTPLSCYNGTQLCHVISHINPMRTILTTTRALTLKHREAHGCIVSTVATDALVQKHQAISIHNAD